MLEHSKFYVNALRFKSSFHCSTIELVYVSNNTKNTLKNTSENNSLPH